MNIPNQSWKFWGFSSLFLLIEDSFTKKTRDFQIRVCNSRLNMNLQKVNFLLAGKLNLGCDVEIGPWIEDTHIVPINLSFKLLILLCMSDYLAGICWLLCDWQIPGLFQCECRTVRNTFLNKHYFIFKWYALLHYLHIF